MNQAPDPASSSSTSAPTGRRRFGRVLGAAVLVLATVVSGGTVLAQSGLIIGRAQSNFGRHTLRGGFTPDPYSTSIVSGGALDASRMGLAPGCRGFVTRQPDFILDYENAANFLRLYATAQGDTTLLVNDGAGRWHCNDDSHGGLNPTVDIANPPSGQYDIWVGSYRARENIRARLNITELRRNHP